MDDGNKECLYITSIISGKKLVIETFSAFSTGLYHTTIKPIESYQKFNDPKTFVLWHDRLGHPGSSMMRRIIENSQGHELIKPKDPLVPQIPMCCVLTRQIDSQAISYQSQV